MNKRNKRRRRGEGGLFRRGRVYWIAYVVNGKKVWETSKSVKEKDARDLLQLRLGEVRSGRTTSADAEKVTVAQLADGVVSDYRANKLDTLDKAIRSANRVKKFFGNMKAHTVTGAVVNNFRDARLAEGAANGTVNRELAFLKRAFNLGIKGERVNRKPWISMLKEDNVRKGFFEYHEYESLRQNCPAYFKPVLTFGYFSGWRKQEILSLTWDRVDLHEGEIWLEVGETKNGEGRVYKPGNEIMEVLEAQWENRKVIRVPGQPALLSRYVFHHDGRRIGGKRGDIRDVWQKSCCATEVLDRRGEKVTLGQMVEVERKGRRVKRYEGRLFHDLRRSGCRDLIRSGITKDVAKKISGHRTDSVFSRYNITSTDDVVDAAAKRSAYLKEQQEKARKVVIMERAKNA